MGTNFHVLIGLSAAHHTGADGTLEVFGKKSEDINNHKEAGILISMAEDRTSIIPWLSKFVTLSLAIAVLIWFRQVAVLAFIAFILASAIRPVVRFGRKYFVPAAVSIFATYALMFTVISVLLSLIVPPLAQETSLLVTRGTEALGLSEMNLVQELSLDVTQLGQIAQNFDQYNGILTQLTGSVQVVLGLLVSTFSLLFVIFSLLVIAFHMLSGIERVSLSFAWMLPRKTREEQAHLALTIMDSLTQQLGSWVRGQLLLMFVIGTATYFGLLALGVPYALPLAIIAGFLEFIPNLGPTIAAIPAVIVAFVLVNPVVGFLTLAFYIILQQIENNFIVPGIMKEAVDVQPITTILLLLVGFEAMGVIGAVISVPLYVAVRCIVRYIWPDNGPFVSYAKYLPSSAKQTAKKTDK